MYLKHACCRSNSTTNKVSNFNKLRATVFYFTDSGSILLMDGKNEGDDEVFANEGAYYYIYNNIFKIMLNC